MTSQKVPQRTIPVLKCTIEGCDGKGKYVRGYCRSHYARLMRNGDFEYRRRLHTNTFWDYIVKGETEDDCWQWTGPTVRNGYGRITVNYKQHIAHRYSYFLANGEWPEPLCLHSCDNPPCCNPKHLRAGTDADNMKDRSERNWSDKGENHFNHKLTSLQVAQIKTDLIHGMSTRKLAVKYNIHRSSVANIKAGRSWKWLTPPILT